MNLTLLTLDLNALWAMAAPVQTGAEPQNPIMMMIPYVLMIAVFYFILIRPQMKAKKEQDRMVSSLKSGDEVVTSGGIMGTVAQVKEGSVMLKIADNVKIEIVKSHISVRTESTKKD